MRYVGRITVKSTKQTVKSDGNQNKPAALCSETEPDVWT